MRLIDLHEDIAYSSSQADVRTKRGQSSLRMLKALGDVTVFAVVYPHVTTYDERSEAWSRSAGKPETSSWPIPRLLFEQLKFYLFLEKEGRANVVRTARDLDSPGVKLLLALEGTDGLQDPYDTRLLRELHVHSVGLTWNYDTKFAASCKSRKDYGLTGYGEELVKECNRLGLIVDLAHSSKKTVLDTAAVTKRPVIASHANARRLRDHARNLDDEEIEAVVGTGGVVGVTAIPSTLSETPRMEDIVRHAKYIGDKFGWEHVALGTDFLGIEKTPAGFGDVSKAARLSRLLGEHAEDVLWRNAHRLLVQALPR